MSPRFGLLGVLVALTACNDSTDPGTPPAFAILPTEQWSGGTVTVRSQAFATGNPVVEAEGAALTVARVDDTTITVTLPQRGSGTVALSLARPQGDLAIGSVSVYGFASAATVPTGMVGQLFTARLGGAPMVFGSSPGGSPAEYVLTGINLAAGTAITYDSLINPGGPYGPSVSYVPGEFIVVPGRGGTPFTTELEAWGILPPAFPVQHPGGRHLGLSGVGLLHGVGLGGIHLTRWTAVHGVGQLGRLRHPGV